jgi:DNA-binding transcriptional regulator YhcF (GntR family)
VDVRIDPRDRTPAGEQLRRQLLDRIRSGALPPSAKLPTVRGLANQLGIATGTVAKVYRDLEQEGVIETNGRFGTIVASSADPVLRQAEQAAQAYADRVRALGLGAEEAVALLRTALGTPPPARG